MSNLNSRILKTENRGKIVCYKKEIEFEVELNNIKKVFVIELYFNEDLGIKTLNYLLIRKVANLNPKFIGEWEKDIYYQLQEKIFYFLNKEMGNPDDKEELENIADKIENKVKEVIEGENIEIKYKVMEFNIE